MAYKQTTCLYLFDVKKLVLCLSNHETNYDNIQANKMRKSERLTCGKKLMNYHGTVTDEVFRNSLHLFTVTSRTI